MLKKSGDVGNVAVTAAKPIIAAKEPVTVDLKGGETYYWCSCGRSRSQPMCDGSHAGTGLEPLEFKPGFDMQVRLCACKQTKKAPYCDGSHFDLP